MDAAKGKQIGQLEIAHPAAIRVALSWMPESAFICRSPIGCCILLVIDNFVEGVKLPAVLQGMTRRRLCQAECDCSGKVWLVKLPLVRPLRQSRKAVELPYMSHNC